MRLGTVMRPVIVVALFGLSISAAGDQPAPRTMKVVLPKFAGTSEAMAFANDRLAAGLANAGGQSGRRSLLEAVAAFSSVGGFRDASDEDRLSAGIGGAEALLALGSGSSAMASLTHVPAGVARQSQRYHEFLERGGEAGELIRQGSGAPTFEKAMLMCSNSCSDGWSTLIMYRSGLARIAQGDGSAAAAAHLERALERLPKDSRQAVFARAALARAYARLRDYDRAFAHMQLARADSSQALSDAPLPRTFLADPAGPDLSKFLEDSQKEIDSARAKH